MRIRIADFITSRSSGYGPSPSGRVGGRGETHRGDRRGRLWWVSLRPPTLPNDCMASTPDRINFGSMAEQGAEAVWNGEGYQTCRDALSAETPPEDCRSCAIYSRTFR